MATPVSHTLVNARRYPGSVAEESNAYRRAGVDVDAGDRAVELMKRSVMATHGPEVLGGVGGFAGLFDVGFLKNFRSPLLATSTDGVGTKVAIAKELDRHDTIGQDLVGMVVDDIVVVGAKPFFMTDYIACGQVVPERIAEIVGGIANACRQVGVALVGGETAEHPGLLGVRDYDVAGAAVGAVEADALLGAHRVRDGDVVIAIPSSGLHSNGFSLVRRILAERGVTVTDHSDSFGGVVGDVLLEPTRLYTSAVLAMLDDPACAGAVHALSHITGGGLAANLGRVLPSDVWVDIDRSTWTPPEIFSVLADLGNVDLSSAEGVWNMGVGFVAVVDSAAEQAVISAFERWGMAAWTAGRVSEGLHDGAGYERNAKGVSGGAVRLVSEYRV